MATDKRERKLSFSSEIAAERWFGREILDHSPESVRMEFMASGRAPLLLYHDQRRIVGVISEAKIGRDRRGHSIARFGRSAAAEDTLRDVDDGILTNVSVAYVVHAMRLEETDDEKGDTYRVTDWEPLENSLVGIPLDPTVGVGRDKQLEFDTRDVHVPSSPAGTAVTTEVTRMSLKDKNAPAGAAADTETLDQPDSPTKVVVVRQQESQLSAEDQMKQKRKIVTNLCIGAGFDASFARSFLERRNTDGSGLSFEQISEEIVKAVAERGRDDPQTPTLVGMTRREVRRYSITRALRASMSRDWSKAGLELEAHKAVCANGMNPRGEVSFFVPYDLMVATPEPPSRFHSSFGSMMDWLQRMSGGYGQRDMTVAGVSGSQFLVGTEHMAGSFIELLRPASVALRLGFTRLQGLKGNVSIPRQTAGGSVFWLADENTAITESQPTIGQLNLVPKNIAALTEISHTLVMQSDPSVDSLVFNNIARDIGTGLDIAALRGSGASGQPQGIVGTSGVGAVTGTGLAYPGILEFQTDVGAANALGLGGAAYVTTFPIAADMKATMIAANTYSPIWVGRLEEGSIDSYPGVSSNNLAAGSMIFGAWPTGVIGEWGVLELMMNPFSDFTRGLTSIRGWYTVDIGLRYPGAFSVSTNVT